MKKEGQSLRSLISTPAEAARYRAYKRKWLPTVDAEVLVTRPLEGWYEVCGLNFRTEMLKKTFNVKPEIFIRRVRRDGVPPEIALLMPESTYEALNVGQRWALSWSYWCKREKIPETDSDLWLGQWSSRPDPVFVDTSFLAKGPPKRSVGRDQFAKDLCRAGNHPVATMHCWMFAAGTSEQIVAPGLDFRTEPYDPETAWLLPILRNNEYRLQGVRALLRLIRPTFEKTGPVFDDLSMFIGWVVYVRRIVRMRAVLLDLNALEHAWTHKEIP